MAYNYMYERCPKITYIYTCIYIYRLDTKLKLCSLQVYNITTFYDILSNNTPKIKTFFSSFFDIALLVEFMIKYAFILLI